MKFAIASLSVLLVACTPPPASTNAASPVATSRPAPAVEAVAKRAAGQEEAGSLQIFRAFGTEPFWSVGVMGDRLTFTTPEDQSGVVMEGKRRALEGGVDIAGIVKDGRQFSLRMRPGACSDGMSDNSHAMTASFAIGEARYSGCADVAK